MKLTIDPEFRDLIPPLSAEEYSQLESNLKAEGCRDPLVTWQGFIIDGHNRFEICTRLGISFEKIIKQFPDRSQAIEWIIRNQFGRRNLSAFQRTELALRLEASIKERAKANQTGGQGGVLLKQKSAEANEHIETREEIAKLAGVSRDTVDKVKQINKSATPEIKEALAKGEISINKAHQTVKAPKSESETESDPEPVVVDESRPKPRIKIIETNGMQIYIYAKGTMDRINKSDTQWEQALKAMISYCQNRLDNRK